MFALDRMLECSDNQITPPAPGFLAAHAIVPPTLLIVAERDDVRSALEHTLRLYGVRHVQSVPESLAVTTAAKMVPDVIVVGADQHVDRSAAVIRRFRADLVTRHTPIVARVGATSQSSNDALRNAGADRVLLATTESSTLINTVIRLSDVPEPCRALRELRRSLAGIRQRAGDTRTDASAVRVRTAQLSSALQQFRLCMLAAESNGTCVAVNATTSAVTGLPRGELVGKHLWDIVASSGRDLRTSWESIVVVGAINTPCVIRRRDGAGLQADMCAAAAILPDLHVAAIQTTTP
jgi:PAS domain-containing protein